LDAHYEGEVELDDTKVPFLFFSPHKEAEDTYSLENKIIGKTYEINSAAALIALLSNGKNTIKEITEVFRNQFNISTNEATEAVNSFLKELEKTSQLVYRSSKVIPVNPPVPDYLILEITNKCNLNCIHCSVNANERYSQELTTEEWNRVISEASIMGVRAIGLSGGEPLMRPDFWKIAEHAVGKGLLVGLVSNGLLINEKNIYKIKELNIDVQISLDSSRPEYHNWIRSCDNCFEAVKEKLLLLKDHGVGFTLAGVATSKTYRDLPLLLEYAETVGAKSFRIQPFFPVGRGKLHRNELDLDHEMTKYISDFLLKAAKTSSIEVGGFYFQFALEPNSIVVDQSCEDGSCAAGIGFAGITHDGYMYPCSHIWQLSEDNVKEKPLAEIWVNSRLFNFFRSLKKKDTSKICQECNYFSSCKGGCKAMNILDGNFSSPDYHCWLANK
jgi:radical SAM protein with 4Fe4S-binding SPASM domain